MPEIPCQFTGCDFKSVNDSEQVAIVMFNSHVMIHQGGTPKPSSSSAQKLPPIPRPEIRQDVSDEDWATFLSEWDHFKRCTEIPDERASDHLYLCCEKSLARLLVREDPEIVSRGEMELKAAIRRLAVIKIATSVRRTSLLSAKQKHGESYREFYANVKASALTCNFTVKCTHPCCNERPMVDYTSCVVKDVLIAGIADADIRKEVLGTPDLDDKTDKEIVALVEAKEMALKAWNGASASGTAGLSNYRRGQKPNNAPIDDPLREKLAMKAKCITCSKEISVYRKFPSGRVNKQPYKMCAACFRSSQKSSSSSISAEEHTSHPASEVSGFFIGALGHGQPGQELPTSLVGRPDSVAGMSALNGVVLDHQIFENEGWRAVANLSHPVVCLHISTDESDYREFDVRFPKI